jgi:tetratricopeptide (TPR) repeat protein
MAVKERILSVLADETSGFQTERRQIAYFKAKLSEIYIFNGRHKEARRLWRDCTDMLATNLPSDCKDMAVECQSLFDLYSKEKRYREAQQLATGMTGFGFDRNVLVSVANGFSALSQYRETSGDTQKAIALIERSLAVSEKYGGKQNHGYADALTRKAQLLKKVGRVEEAAESEKQATRLREELQRLGVRRYG